MSRIPEAADLLLTARDVLLEQLLTALAPELHYQARMIANALAIAAREQQGAAHSDNAHERVLATAIRAGQRDDQATFHELLAITRNKLQVSNPRVLTAYAEGGE